MPNAAPRPLAGIAARLAAAATLALMFALVKLAAARGVNLLETVFYRQLFALPLVLGWVAAGPGLASLKTARIGAHGVRATLGLSGMALNFLGMVLLPLSLATTIGFSVPLFATIFAALILGEPTGRYRWAAVIIGFGGVVFVARPDGALIANYGSLIALAGAVVTALVTIQIRQLSATEPSARIVFWFTALSLIPMGTLMLWYGEAHPPGVWLLLLGIGGIGGAAQLFLTTALRLAPVAVVLPMDYTGFIWASLFGWLFFDALPTPATLVGAPIIMLSGLVILWREHRLGRAASAQTIIPMSAAPES
jgi:drug/metabolite transporter (DMT)-like permease